ncbi:lycopene cyclase domain-containing protein [Nocardioides sp.]|uniref:lycopene cyclase domain-containing protein n=1 Tax=Nocardioides sp. TaxID=35761 RepID=UPI00261222FB|nr:lycopene cyclase domain-containing protein [Nocardioides sp.]
MGIYTLTALVSVVVVLAIELLWLRTGILRTWRYWLAMAIVMGFQVPVDGWLTKLSDPLVLYNEADMTGIRAPWDIPVEDFAFGFGMVTLAMVLWVHAGRREERRAGAGSGPATGTAGPRQEQRA